LRDPTSKILNTKQGWRSGLPEFKPLYHPKKKKEKPGFLTGPGDVYGYPVGTPHVPEMQGAEVVVGSSE
jgi:hypothetical protein